MAEGTAPPEARPGARLPGAPPGAAEPATAGAQAAEPRAAAPGAAALAAERAYLYTKDLILRGELSGGQLISEGRICGELGLSRTPVHEAFLRLGTERLLALSSRKGAVVLPVAPQEARNVLEMREAIESTAARRLITDGGPAQEVLSRLRANLEQQEGYAGTADVEAFVEADEEFHSGVVAASGNPIAVHFFGLLRDRQQRLRHQLLGIRPGHLAVVLDDHRHLVDRLEALDADGYAGMLATHVARHQGAL
ncbi:GntR family transcriptional regulator [Streptomyces sp. TS71-3]|uniref:GntR family transcriptional regulator n=1 Tax=Streptomyces sp. TS71-3 TaxID=2733862 RepID=UPI001BB33107|nr:GntR family transcriptional regulator [Streptomyces sp. TS71-3]